jgi:hypothetical protein
MSPLSPAAQAVLTASAKAACLEEWSTVNDPPCHPSDSGWNGCHLCVHRLSTAAALCAAADQVALMRPHGGRAWTVEQAAAYDALTKAFDLLNAIAAKLDGVTTANQET